MAMIPQFQASYTATAATVAIGTNGILVHSILFPKTSAGTVALSDTAGNTYVAFPSATIAGTYLLDIVCNAGLKIVQGSASDQVTVTWQAL